MRVCVFDLDHTLVRSPLDLAAMALDMRALVEARWGPLPARAERYRVGELISHCQREAPHLEPPIWAIALDHERRALAGAALEPGARDAVTGARRAGFATAIWTNNAREVTVAALERLEIANELDLIVTRDEMTQLKPDPAGWQIIAKHFGLPRTDGARGTAHAAADHQPRVTRDDHHALSLTDNPHGRAGQPQVFMVGDSWVDGVAAAAAGVPFIAYRVSSADLERWRITPVAHLDDLRALPDWLADR
jgi:phosphoglycolate phosphatase